MCFYTSLGSGKKNTSHTSRYSTKSTPLVLLNEKFSKLVDTFFFFFFSYPGGLITVQTVSYFFSIEWFLGLKNIFVRGSRLTSSDRTIRFKSENHSFMKNNTFN